jgi:UTP--glucose-1-phosphate uridylyltransferase
MGKIDKCVIPAAGIGSRMLPITKVIPKEVLPLINIPVIYYGVEEAKKSGVSDMIFITSPDKTPVIDFFDYSPLQVKYPDLLVKYSNMVKLISIRQSFPKGLGDAINRAADIIDDDYFFVVLPDDLILSEKPVLLQMKEAFDDREGIYISLMEVAEKDVSKYGIVSGELISDKVFRIDNLIEKPPLDKAPSRYAVIGRYILSKKIFNELLKTKPGKNGEIQLTDAIKALIGKIPVYGYIFEGERYDTGNGLGFVKANIRFSMENREIKEDILSFIKEILNRFSD